MTAQVCLCYDDALPVHREAVGPALAERGMRATFYVPAARDDLHREIEGWRRLARLGHELGNHSCWHPCRTRAEWAWKPPYRLEDYDAERIRDELLLANRILRLIDGRTERSYGATCGDLSCGPGGGMPFLDRIRDLFSGVRAGLDDRPMTGPAPFVLPTRSIDGETSADVIAALQSMRELEDGWMLLSLHGVGAGTHAGFMDAREHGDLIDWIARQSDWLRAVTVTEAIRAHPAPSGNPPGSLGLGGA